jgi:hypothetical protein
LIVKIIYTSPSFFERPLMYLLRSPTGNEMGKSTESKIMENHTVERISAIFQTRGGGEKTYDTTQSD